MDTQFTRSADGTRIAYDCCGAGPALVLVHGGGTNRQDWHTAGYVRRLQENFTVITLDLRGHGESELPTTPQDYTTGKMGADILAAADACGAERFAMWGMSFGGKVSRYLALRSERVTRYIMMGTPLGPGVSGERRRQAIDFCAHWEPIIKAQCEGTLDAASLSKADREMLAGLNVPAMLGWVSAMLDWPAVEPADFRCPTLWLIGSEDEHAMASHAAYKPVLEGSQVQANIAAGLDHDQVFDELEVTFPVMLAFTKEAKDI